MFPRPPRRPACGRPSRARRRAVVALGLLMVAGIFAMHALSTTGTSAARAASDAASRAAPAGPMEHLVVAAHETGLTAGSGGHAGTSADDGTDHGAAGHAHAIAGACLVLLLAAALWLLAGSPRAGLRLSVSDPLSALSISVDTRRRGAPRPDLHALSVLRC